MIRRTTCGARFSRPSSMPSSSCSPSSSSPPWATPGPSVTTPSLSSRSMSHRGCEGPPLGVAVSRSHTTPPERPRGLPRARLLLRRGSGEGVMQIGDTVTVRVSGRRARITEERGGVYVIEYLPDPTSDPMDRETVQSNEAGLYRAEDLEPVD